MEGQYTRQSGFLAYYEICPKIKEGWTVVQDPEGRIGPYAHSGNQWVSFDDVKMIEKKVHTHTHTHTHTQNGRAEEGCYSDFPCFTSCFSI